MTDLTFIPRSLREPEPEPVDWPLELDHLSATSFGMLMRCPEQWRRRYVLGERQRPALAVVQGKADHVATEYNFKKKVESHADLPVEDVKEVFASEFDRQIDEAGGLAELDFNGSDGDPKTLAAKAKDSGVELVAGYRTEVAPFVLPESVEDQFEIPMPGIPVPVRGYLDVVALDFNPLTQEAAEGTRKVVERKVVGRATVQPQHRFQAGVYQLASKLPVDFHLSVKAGKGKYVWGTPELRVELTELKLTRLLELMSMAARSVGEYYRTYGPDNPWPGAITHPWACGYCGFRADCPWPGTL